jgi:Domain of unknown function (DUF5753)
VPGLLQIEDYTRGLIAAGLPSATRDIEELVAFRMSRQAVVEQLNPPEYQAVIGEAALHEHVGTSSIMRDQLQRLAAKARLQHVDLRVIPYSASACLWLAGPFHLLSLRPPGRLTVSVVEHFSQSIFMEDQLEVATHEKIFNRLLTAALNQSSSLALIERIMSEL